MKTTRQELLERKKLSNIIMDWAVKNKKVFWKYEVSSFYKTYIIKIANLPNPSTNDIIVSSNNRLLNDQQKSQLCNAIKKGCTRPEVFSNFSIDIQIDYISDAVVAELI